MVNSSRRRRPRHHQSAKPHPDFPLTAHPSGRWCKKIKGRTFEQNGKVPITEDAPAEEGDGDKKAKPTTNNDNEITKEFNKLFAEAGLERKVGRSFYFLRQIFETVAGESRDQVAVDHIMGYARDDMASVYRERVGDDRLKAVAMHVHAWLFPRKSGKSRMHASGRPK
jgi:hypothetical protein